MRHVLMIAAALSLSLGGVASAKDHPGPYKADAAGKCRAADGTFAKKGLCSGGAGPATKATSAMTAKAPDPGAPYKLDAKGKCHDVKGKMAAKAKCAA